MSQTIETIAQLEDDQISAINAYLMQHNIEVFTAKQIEFLKNLDDLDVLSLASGCAVVRGYLGDFSGRNFIGRNEEGLSIKQALDKYEDSLDKDDYEPNDLAELIADKTNELESEVAAHGIILFTGKYAESEILFLNKDFAPIYMNYVRF